MARTLQSLLMVVVCTFLFASVVMAQEEPKAKPQKVVKESASVQKELGLTRSCASKVKSRFTQRFGNRPSGPSFMKSEAAGCYGWCDCFECDCWYDGDIGCCFDGCDWCWGVLDGRGDCGVQ